MYHFYIQAQLHFIQSFTTLHFNGVQPMPFNRYHLISPPLSAFVAPAVAVGSFRTMNSKDEQDG